MTTRRARGPALVPVLALVLLRGLSPSTAAEPPRTTTTPDSRGSVLHGLRTAVAHRILLPSGSTVGWCFHRAVFR
jgi:hypothetical protein